jgi:hypothetical protein
VRGFRRHDGARNWHHYEAIRGRPPAFGSIASKPSPAKIEFCPLYPQ